MAGQCILIVWLEFFELHWGFLYRLIQSGFYECFKITWKEYMWIYRYARICKYKDMCMCDSVVELCAKSLQLCLTLCDPLDCRPPGSSVHRILQARILEWVVKPFSRVSPWPRDQTWVSPHCRQILCHLSHQGSPKRKLREKPGHVGAGVWGLWDKSETKRWPEEAEHNERSSGRVLE